MGDIDWLLCLAFFFLIPEIFYFFILSFLVYYGMLNIVPRAIQ